MSLFSSGGSRTCDGLLLLLLLGLDACRSRQQGNQVGVIHFPPGVHHLRVKEALGDTVNTMAGQEKCEAVVGAELVLFVEEDMIGLEETMLDALYNTHASLAFILEGRQRERHGVKALLDLHKNAHTYTITINEEAGTQEHYDTWKMQLSTVGVLLQLPGSNNQVTGFPSTIAEIEAEVSGDF